MDMTTGANLTFANPASDTSRGSSISDFAGSMVSVAGSGEGQAMGQ